MKLRPATVDGIHPLVPGEGVVEPLKSGRVWVWVLELWGERLW